MCVFCTHTARRRINQDELGSRGRCLRRATDFLRRGFDVVIDRCNGTSQQRSIWIGTIVLHVDRK